MSVSISGNAITTTGPCKGCCSTTGTGDCSACSRCSGTGTAPGESRYLTITGSTDCNQTLILRCGPDTDVPAGNSWSEGDPFGDSNLGFFPGPCLAGGTIPPRGTAYVWKFSCTPTTAQLDFEPAVGLGTPISFSPRVYRCNPLYAEFDLSPGIINVNLCCDGGPVTGVVTA